MNPLSWTVFKQFWQVARQDKGFWKAAGYMFAAMMLFEVNAMVVPLFFFEGLMRRDTVAVGGCAVVFLVILAIRGLCLHLAMYYVHGIEERGFTEFFDNVVGKMQDGLLERHHEVISGTATRWFTAWFEFTQALALQLFTAACCLCVGLTILLIRQPLLVVPFVCIVVAYSIFIWRKIEDGVNLATEATASQAKAIGSLETMVAVRRMRWLQKNLADRALGLRDVCLISLQAYRHFQRYRANGLRVMEWLTYAVLLVSVVGFCAQGEKAFPTTDLVTITHLFLTFVIMTTLHLQSLSSAVDRLSRACSEGALMSHLISDEPSSLPAPSYLSRSNTQIEIDAVANGKRFKEVIEKGITAVTGSMSSGKTTLFEMIAGVMLPEEGQVRICGFSTTEWALDKWSIYVVQDPPTLNIEGSHFFPPNVMYSSVSGISTIYLEENLQHLSGGTTRLTYLEGAFSTAQIGGVVLLLDEPTTGLETDRVAGLIGGLRQLIEDNSMVFVIIATHDDRIVDAADHVIELR